MQHLAGELLHGLPATQALKDVELSEGLWLGVDSMFKRERGVSEKYISVHVYGGPGIAIFTRFCPAR